MKLYVAGLSHKTAPVEIRERLAVPDAAVAALLDTLRDQTGAIEALVLSTCNRVEVAITADDASDPLPAVELALGRGFDAAPYLFRYEGRDAIQHLFRVASSLDSMIVGEPQILGQLKQAYAASKSRGAVTGLLDSVITRAFSVAKRVRSETGIGQMAVSISYAAVELARKIFGSLEGRSVMIAGAGKMSELSARHLRRSGAANILVTNRTFERAEEMARAFGGTPVEWQRFPSMLPEVDIVIASTAAPDYIIDKPAMQHVMKVRRNRPVFLIDIAVPRNIQPAVNEIDNVYLYDIDDLQEVVNANLREREKEASHAERIVAEEVDRLLGRLKVQEVTPTIVGLQEQLEQIRTAEIDRMRRKLGALSPQQEEAIEALTRGIVNKIAHLPITELRRHAAEPEGHQVIDAIRKVFHLK